jgi:hypothetical protein
MRNYDLKIDSARISIPIDYCEILNKDLIDTFQLDRTNLNTGEQTTTSTYIGEPFILSTDYGTFYKIWIHNQPSGKGISETFLSILINSKHLGADYFKGITKETVHLLYQNIMEQNVFKCTLNDFLKSRYTDTDIAFDIQDMSKEHFEILKSNIKGSTLYPERWNSTHKPTNSGIWTPKTPKNVKPRDFATPSKPYVKFYDKQIDFETKSNVFAQHFDLIEQSKNVVRFECTIKNSEHKKLLKIRELKTFGDLLNSDLTKIASDIFKRYFEKRKFVKQNTDTPMDKSFVYLINLAISKGATKQEIYKGFDLPDVSRKSNHNLQAKYHKLYSTGKIKKEMLEANETSKSIFEFLGVEEQLKINLED